jgi:hypothetical protein
MYVEGNIKTEKKIVWFHAREMVGNCVANARIIACSYVYHRRIHFYFHVPMTLE